MPHQEEKCPTPTSPPPTGPEGALVDAYLVGRGTASSPSTARSPSPTGAPPRTTRGPRQAAARRARHPCAPRPLRRHRRARRLRRRAVIARAGVDAVIRRDDAVKERSYGPSSATVAARARVPTRTVSDGERIDLGARFTVLDLGPGESPHDSVWFSATPADGFLGDQIYDPSTLTWPTASSRMARPPRRLRRAPLRRDPPHRTRRPVTPAGRWQRQYVATGRYGPRHRVVATRRRTTASSSG